MDEEAERDAESAWRLAKASYLHACKCLCAREEKEKR